MSNNSDKKNENPLEKYAGAFAFQSSLAVYLMFGGIDDKEGMEAFIDALVKLNHMTAFLLSTYTNSVKIVKQELKT